MAPVHTASILYIDFASLTKLNRVSTSSCDSDCKWS